MTEFASYHTEAKPAGWSSGKRHCYQCGQGQIQGGVGDGAILKPVFHEDNFFIISNLFNNNKSHAQSTHNRKSTKMHYIW